MLYTIRSLPHTLRTGSRLQLFNNQYILTLNNANFQRTYTSDSFEVDSSQRLPKRKVALLLSFCGAGYQGMQNNPNAKTIEGELFKALVAAGAVSKENSSDQNKVSLMRAARTDKGVHAAGQVVSLKMILHEAMITRINQHLPEHIQAWDYVRVPKSFNPKNFCDSRVYSYLLPTHILATSPSISSTPPLREGDVRVIPGTTKEERESQRRFRVSSEKVKFLRKLSEKFLGTHNFHNFTVGKSFTDSSVKRYIMKFECSEPQIIDGFEWINCQIQGQAFMLHQIRKMIGLMILMTRANSSPSLIDDAFLAPKLNIPKAPGISLVLEKPIFSTYNRLALIQGKKPIDFGQYKDLIEQFRVDHINSSITTLAIQNDCFDQWIKSLYTFPESFDYL